MVSSFQQRKYGCVVDSSSIEETVCHFENLLKKYRFHGKSSLRLDSRKLSAEKKIFLGKCFETQLCMGMMKNFLFHVIFPWLKTRNHANVSASEIPVFQIPEKPIYQINE